MKILGDKMYRDIAELPMQRRAFERHEVALSVQYKPLQEVRAPLKGTLTVDISGGGLRILSEEFLPVASKVKVYISRPTGSAPIEAACQVVWERLLPHSERYEVGLRSVGIGEAQRNLTRGKISGRDVRLNCVYDRCT